jgi:hypothetical protein
MVGSKKLLFTALMFGIALGAQPNPPTQVAASAYALPVVSEPRVMVVLPNGVRAFARLDPSLELVGGPTPEDPPVLRAVGVGGGSSTSLDVVVGTFDLPADDGSFTWTGAGVPLLVFKNGVAMRHGPDYIIPAANRLTFSDKQNWMSTDSVLIVLASTGNMAPPPVGPPVEPTRVGVDQVASDLLEWTWAPSSAKASCISGNITVDVFYNLYLCVPDRNYMKPGHLPYLWLKIKPDPTFVPPGYHP